MEDVVVPLLEVQATGEVAILNPWASTPEFQVVRGISSRDLTSARR
jgi:endoglucanase